MPPDPVDGAYPEAAFHMLPQTAWYSVGLLLRDGPGDRDRAIRALDTVLDHQYDEPGEVWHGTFTLVHEIPPPRPGARMWVDYDPNWRQFIGCTLLLILRRLGDLVPGPLVGRIDRALRLAVEGEHAEADGRRIPDSYSNIALMQAYVEVEAGHRLGEPTWVAAGEDRARRAVARFDRHGAFDEFNSPTYHGIDLKALGLWRGHSSSAVLTELGARVEAELWDDAARWYHAGLRQVAGPYTRAYGMDLGVYVGAWALWVWAALGRAHAPLPSLERPLAHGMDLVLGPVAALIGAVVPDEARRHLTAFTGERVVRRRISAADDGDRVAIGLARPGRGDRRRVRHRRPLVVGPVPRGDRALAPRRRHHRLAPGQGAGPLRRHRRARPPGPPVAPRVRRRAPLRARPAARRRRPGHPHRVGGGRDPARTASPSSPCRCADYGRRDGRLIHGNKAVVAAMFANGAIAIAKFVGFGLTGSSAMLAEGVHSVADTGQPGAAAARRAAGQEDGERGAPVRLRPGAVLLVVRRGARAVRARLGVRHLRGHPQAPAPRGDRGSADRHRHPRLRDRRRGLLVPHRHQGDTGGEGRRDLPPVHPPRQDPRAARSSCSRTSARSSAWSSPSARSSPPTRRATPTGTPTAPSRSACCSASSPSSS